ncbi:hypothetical protein M405DRAFT_253409 [Rhizopogon salebrosus TDB-379]|nr:hypothetical protein M405DRAFT_253409 [Rhizopogon salebrosus TDB-379]
MLLLMDEFLLSGFTPSLSAWSHVFNLVMGYGLIVCGTRIFACNILYIQMQLPILPPNRHECIRLLPRPNALFTHVAYSSTRYVVQWGRAHGARKWHITSRISAASIVNFGQV